MSTMIALLLVLSTLSGCAGETLANVKNALPPRAAAVTLTVEVEPYEETVRDEDSAILVECSYELPVMRALLEDGTPLEEAVSPEQEAALAAAETFNARFSGWRTNARTLLNTMREEAVFQDEDETGLFSAVCMDALQCTVYQTESLVSVSGVYSTYTGGAHPNSILMSWNFDLETGEFFEPELLNAGGDFQAFVHEELLSQARKAAAEMDTTPENIYWKDYEDTLAEWSSYAVSFDEEGMTVGFSPYELTSYVAGPQVFRISYEQLYPHLGEHSKALLGLDAGGEEAEN